MVKFLADENFNNRIVRGVLRRNPKIDIPTIQQVGLSGIDDPAVLGWTLSEKRILLTHDVKTIPFFAYERIEKNEPIPGILLVALNAAIGQIIDDIVLIAECSDYEEWEGQIFYLPL